MALHKNTCPYKNCWNPDCLYVGTHTDNMNDIRDKNVCPKCNRPYDNIIKLPGGKTKRRCRFCNNEYNKLHRRMKRATS